MFFELSLAFFLPCDLSENNAKESNVYFRKRKTSILKGNLET